MVPVAINTVHTCISHWPTSKKGQEKMNCIVISCIRPLSTGGWGYEYYKEISRQGIERNKRNNNNSRGAERTGAKAKADATRTSIVVKAREACIASTTMVYEFARIEKGWLGGWMENVDSGCTSFSMSG